MNIKGNLSAIIAGSAIFIIIYIFFAAAPLGEEIYFEPLWTTDISETIPPQIPFTDSLAFILGDRFGYFDADGTILSSNSTELRISASNYAWTTYASDTNQTEIFYPDGTSKMKISQSGFIHLITDRTFLFHPGGDAVSEFSNSGEKLWMKEHTAPITAFDASKSGTVIGYADGMILVLNTDGKEIFSFSPGGSNHSAIFGAAISENGEYVACISGLDKQRLLLIKIQKNQYKIVHHTYLDKNSTRQCFVGFDEKNKYAYFETAQGIIILSCKEYSYTTIPVDGKIHSITEYKNITLILTQEKSDSLFSLYAIGSGNKLIGKNSFSAHAAYVIHSDDELFLGTDTKISKIRIRGIE